jgi:hypothetical protein
MESLMREQQATAGAKPQRSGHSGRIVLIRDGQLVGKGEPGATAPGVVASTLLRGLSSPARHQPS